MDHLAESTSTAHPHVHQHGCCSHDHTDEISIYRQSTASKLHSCDAFRLTAAALFHEGQFARSAQWFQRILVYLDYTFCDCEADQSRYDELRHAAHVNMCVCAVKRGEYGEAVRLANVVLSSSTMDSKKSEAKALYCRGKAKRALGMLDEARTDLLGALEAMEEEDHLGRARQDVMRELEVLRDAQQRSAASEREFARGMFAHQRHHQDDDDDDDDVGEEEEEDRLAYA